MGIRLCVVAVCVWGTSVGLARGTAAPRLAAVVLGDGKLEGREVLEQEGRRVAMFGRGGGDFQHDDTGSSFAFLETDAQRFTLVARVAQVAPIPAGASFGIAVRAGLGAFDRMIALRCVRGEDGDRLEWMLRHGPSRSTHDGSARLLRSGGVPVSAAGEGLWLKLVRHYPTVALYWSADGETWRSAAGEYHLALLEQKVTVGLMLTAGGDGASSATIAFDHVTFTQEDPEPGALSRGDYVEFHEPKQPWQMFLIQADTTRYGPDSQAFFLLKPKSLAWRDVRAAIYTTGDKEVMLDDYSRLAFESGPQKRRRPQGMSTWEGVYELNNLRPWYQVLAHYRVVRLASPGRSEPVEQALAEMAASFSAPEIAHLPLFTTGASACGGQAAQTANALPQRTIGSMPVLIGAAGADLENTDALGAPRLYVYGSKDSGGAHHRQLVQLDSEFRGRGSLWGAAPLWQGYHRWWYTDRILTPYLLSLVDLRVPSDAELAAGPVALHALKEASGYLGLNDTWGDPFPQAVAWKDATIEQRRGDSSWLPDAVTARVWQAFVRDWPRTVIHFPRYDGRGGFGGGLAHPGREDHFLPAGEPWNLVASGPLGEGITVDYYAGLNKLRVLRRYLDNPYLVQLEALPPGLHVIYAITTDDKGSEISHPSTIMFQARTR